MAVTKASQQLLLDSINETNGLSANPLTLTQIGLGLPLAATTSDATFNTYCTVYGLYGKGYYGSVTVRYRRYDLGTFFLNVVPTIIQSGFSPGKLSDLLPYLNDRYGLALTTADIVDVNFPYGTTDIVTTLTAKDTNWAWLGSTPIRFAQALPYFDSVVPLDTEVTALTETLPFTTKPRAEYVVYGYEWSAIADTLRQASAGTAITADQLQAIQSVSTQQFSFSASDTQAVNLNNAVWGGPIVTGSSTLYNHEYGYVNTLTLDSTSNYEGQLIFHYDV